MDLSTHELDMKVFELQNLLRQSRFNEESKDKYIDELRNSLFSLEKEIKSTKKNDNDVFDEMYEKYSKEVDNFSGGIVTTDKAEFLKLYAFYSSTIQPIINKYVEAYTGKKIK